MKKFSQFVKKNGRRNHLCWAEGDIEPILEGLQEWSPENPKIEGKAAHFREPRDKFTGEPGSGFTEPKDHPMFHNHRTTCRDRPPS